MAASEQGSLSTEVGLKRRIGFNAGEYTFPV
jgi:hypothetical protein